jgi:pyrimidine-nucleoside phosphorylase
VDTEKYGEVSLILGAGRNTKDDKIDPAAGFILKKKTGDAVRRGDVIATLYTTDKPQALEEAAEMMLSATVFSEEAPDPVPLILGIIE